MKHFLYFLSLTVLFSCSVQKRKYQKGFYISRIHQKSPKPAVSETQTAHEQSNKVIEHVIPVTTGERVETADAGSPEIFTPKKTSLFQAAEDSCDVLLFKDGSEIRAKVLEVGTTDIKYKRCDSKDGPSYVTRKSDLFMIKYSNGTREMIKSEVEVEKQMPVYRQNTFRKPPKVIHPLAPVALAFGILSILVPYISLFAFAATAVFPPFMYVVFFIIPLIAVIVGKTAMNRIKEEPDAYKGKGLAIPGFIMGLVVLCIYLAVLLILLLLLGI